MAMGLRERYLQQGYLHIEGVFDASQVADAIAALEDVPGWIRERRHSDIQRAQPLQSCPAVRERGWLNDFYGNPTLEGIIEELFEGVIEPTPSMARDFKLTALLIEPLDQWWSTGLHRDYRDFIATLDVEAWKARTGDLRLFNQISIPLFPDDCFWAVPGSHVRDDTEAEAAMVAGRSRYRSRTDGKAGAGKDAETGTDGKASAGEEAGPGGNSSDASADTGRLREQLLAELAECGAVNPRCAPGDFLIYRSNMLHCGAYEPRVRRMTVHDGIYSKQWQQFVLGAGNLR